MMSMQVLGNSQSKRQCQTVDVKFVDSIGVRAFAFAEPDSANDNDILGNLVANVSFAMQQPKHATSKPLVVPEEKEQRVHERPGLLAVTAGAAGVRPDIQPAD